MAKRGKFGAQKRQKELKKKKKREEKLERKHSKKLDTGEGESEAVAAEPTETVEASERGAESSDRGSR